MENAFAQIVRRLQPTRELFELARAMFKDAWAQRTAQAQHVVRALNKDITNMDTKIERLVDRLVEGDGPRLVSALETRIAKLEKQKRLMKEKLRRNTKPRHGFDEAFEPACAFLANPYNLWASGQFTAQKLVLRLGFQDRIAYDRNAGFRTPSISLPFKLLIDFPNPENRMAGHEVEISNPQSDATASPGALGVGAGGQAQTKKPAPSERLWRVRQIHTKCVAGSPVESSNSVPTRRAGLDVRILCWQSVCWHPPADNGCRGGLSRYRFQC